MCVCVGLIMTVYVCMCMTNNDSICVYVYDG